MAQELSVCVCVPVCVCACVHVHTHMHMNECGFLGGMRVLVKCGGGNLFQMLNGKQTMMLSHTHERTTTHKNICLINADSYKEMQM